MKLELTVDTGNGPERVTVGPRAIVAWELAGKTKVSTLGKDMALTDLCQLAWHQAKVDGNAPATFDGYMATIVDIDPVAGPDPT